MAPTMKIAMAIAVLVRSPGAQQFQEEQFGFVRSFEIGRGVAVGAEGV
jgi:hypothetical protein